MRNEIIYLFWVELLFSCPTLVFWGGCLFWGVFFCLLFKKYISGFWSSLSMLLSVVVNLHKINDAIDQKKSTVCTKSMIHFQSLACGYMIYTQLLWETTDRDVILLLCQSQDKRTEAAASPLVNKASLKPT